LCGCDYTSTLDGFTIFFGGIHARPITSGHLKIKVRKWGRQQEK